MVRRASGRGIRSPLLPNNFYVVGLIDVDDLAAVVVSARVTHDVRLLCCATIRAGHHGWSRCLVVRTTLCATGLRVTALWIWHESIPRFTCVLVAVVLPNGHQPTLMNRVILSMLDRDLQAAHHGIGALYAASVWRP